MDGKTAAHTPGPWKASEIDEFGDVTIVPEAGGLAIAAVVNGEFMEMGGKGDEHAANARLIAVAPDLLAALQNAKGLLDTPIARRHYAGSDFYAETVNAIRAAITKAEGS